MLLGMAVGLDLGPCHIVLDGDPAPLPPKGAQHLAPLFSACLLWLNGRLSQLLLSAEHLPTLWTEAPVGRFAPNLTQV